MAIGSHHSHKMGKDEWLTPPQIIKALGGFDLDPCSPINRPWDMVIEEEFDIEISDEDADKLQTVAEFVEYVKEKAV